MAVGAARQFHRGVWDGRLLGRLTDVVVAHQAQGRLPVLHDLSSSVLVASVTPVEDRRVDVALEKTRLAGPVGGVTRDAGQRCEIGLEVGFRQVFVLGVVARQADLLRGGLQ